MSENETAVEIVKSIHAFSAGEWDCMAGDHPFLRHAFLSALEDSGSVGPGTGWTPAHIRMRENDHLIAAMPCYLKGHSMGEYVFDHSWAEAYERAGGRYYPKLLAAIPFTPVTGPRFLHDPALEGPDIAARLINGAGGLVRRLGLSSFHITFLSEAEAAFAEANDLLIRHDQQFHWQNRGYRDFEEFLSALASRKRKQIRRERREAASSGIAIKRIPGQELTTADWDSYYRFYLDTAGRKWGRPYLNRDFFAMIAERMPDALLLVQCLDDGKPIAGALNFLSSSRIYGRWWGSVVDRPFLHFEACYYQAIDYAISTGLSWVEAGAQGPHKLLRGYEPAITRSAHHIADPHFRDAVRHYLVHERQDVARAQAALSGHLPFRKDQDAGLRPMPT